jgi:hypothetical protein
VTGVVILDGDVKDIALMQLSWKMGCEVGGTMLHMHIVLWNQHTALLLPYLRLALGIYTCSLIVNRMSFTPEQMLLESQAKFAALVAEFDVASNAECAFLTFDVRVYIDYTAIAISTTDGYHHALLENTEHVLPCKYTIP